MTASGLRRFARPATPAGADDRASVDGRASTAHRADDHAGTDDHSGVERCEMCRVALDDRHGHVVALERRALLCTCRACYLLFTRGGAAGGRFRAVPERYLHDPADRIADADWQTLDIPVSTAFCFINSDLDRVVACYPSPAGATESLPDPQAWRRLAARHPLLAAPLPDVEAIYVTATGAGLQAFLVPIDACYALVGEVRLRWRGIDGGDAVRGALAGFVDDLRRRSRAPDAR